MYTTQWPIWDLDGGLSLSSFLNILIYCLGLDPHMQNLGVCLGVHEQLYVVAFSSSSLSLIFTVLPGTLEFSFWIFQQEILVFIYLALLHTFSDFTCVCGWLIEREKSNRGHSTFLGPEYRQSFRCQLLPGGPPLPLFLPLKPELGVLS